MITFTQHIPPMCSGVKSLKIKSKSLDSLLNSKVISSRYQVLLNEGYQLCYDTQCIKALLMVAKKDSWHVLGYLCGVDLDELNNKLPCARDITNNYGGI